MRPYPRRDVVYLVIESDAVKRFFRLGQKKLRDLRGSTLRAVPLPRQNSGRVGSPRPTQVCLKG